MPMTTPFDGYVEKAARASSTCLISVQRNRYSVPCELAGQMVSTRLYPNQISVVARDTVVAKHNRPVDRGQTGYDWQHYIPLVERQPVALRNGSPFADMPKRQDHGSGTRRRADSETGCGIGNGGPGDGIRRAQYRTHPQCIGQTQRQPGAREPRNELATQGAAAAGQFPSLPQASVAFRAKRSI